MEQDPVETWQLACETISKQPNQNAAERKRQLDRRLSSVALTAVPLTLPRFVGTGISSLDALCGGGLAQSEITEVYGPAGAGKTCIACQAALQASLTGNCVYLACEDTCDVVARRMHTIADSSGVKPRWHAIHFATARSIGEMRVALHKTLKMHPTLVIIDSIAAVFALGGRNTNEIHELGLRAFAAESDAAILVINQVRSLTSDFNTKGLTSGSMNTLSAFKMAYGNKGLADISVQDNDEQYQTLSQSLSQSLSQNLSQPLSQSISQNLSQNLSQSPSQSLSQSPSQSFSQQTQDIYRHNVQRSLFESGIAGHCPAMGLDWGQSLDARIALFRLNSKPERQAQLIFSRHAPPSKIQLLMSSSGLSNSGLSNTMDS